MHKVLKKQCLQKLEKALTAELQGLQRIHVAVADQITRLKVSNGCPRCLFSFHSSQLLRCGTLKVSILEQICFLLHSVRRLSFSSCCRKLFNTRLLKQ